MTIKSQQKNLNILKTKKAFKMKKKTFFIIFKGLSVAKYFFRPEVVPLTILAIKRGSLCNFAKTLMGQYFSITRI